MIKRLKYKDIDWQKYKKCIAESEQKNFYAQKEILDQLSGNWEILVYGDYQAVMPLHIQKKWFVEWVSMPLFCQQLGIFSKNDSTEINQQFLDFLQNKYKVLAYHFNHRNHFFTDIPKKKNYFIPQQDYLHLRKKYFKGRKSTVKTAQFHQLAVLPLDQNALEFITSNLKGLHSHSDEGLFLRYLRYLHSQEILTIFASYKQNVITSMALVIKQENEYSLLGLINPPQYKNDNGASYIIDSILQENISSKNFNFMGGNIRGIEVFFKSFGSEPQNYGYITNSLKDLLFSFLNKN